MLENYNFQGWGKTAGEAEITFHTREIICIVLMIVVLVLVYFKNKSTISENINSGVEENIIGNKTRNAIRETNKIKEQNKTEAQDEIEKQINVMRQIEKHLRNITNKKIEIEKKMDAIDTMAGGLKENIEKKCRKGETDKNEHLYKNFEEVMKDFEKECDSLLKISREKVETDKTYTEKVGKISVSLNIIWETLEFFSTDDNDMRNISELIAKKKS
jgi:hypothetical protein